MHPIKILSQELISIIAAGEVIDGPYSVVKELCENSIDAKAQNIDIFLEDGGKSIIRVNDDGVGIESRFLELSLKRHATSKLYSKDLLDIKTLGFRGEALYAIASVSKIKINSRTTDMLEAKEVVAKYNKVLSIKPQKGKRGTRITVEGIFDDIPARKKFLKNINTEAIRVRDVVKKLALYNTKINFRYYEENEIKFGFDYKGVQDSALEERLIQVMGTEFKKNSLHIKYFDEDHEIRGYVGIPTYNKSTWKDTAIFINGRLIKDKALLGVIKAAYSGLIPGNRQPVVVLFIFVKPERIDVNVHPAKTEIKLENKQSLNSIIITLIRDVLKKAGLIDSISNEKALLSKINTNNVGIRTNQEINFSDNIEKRVTALEELEILDDVELDRNKLLGVARAQINKMFIISQTENCLILIDQHAAHERIVLEKLKNNYFKKSQILSQNLMIPEIINVEENKDLIFNNQDEITRLGIFFEDYADRNILVRAIPAILGKPNIQHLIDDLIKEIRIIGQIDPKHPSIERILSGIACHNSVRAGRVLNIQEMNSLLREMESTPNSSQCNHGRPTFIKLNLKDIQSLFGRT